MTYTLFGGALNSTHSLTPYNISGLSSLSLDVLKTYFKTFLFSHY